MEKKRGLKNKSYDLELSTLRTILNNRLNRNCILVQRLHIQRNMNIVCINIKTYHAVIVVKSLLVASIGSAIMSRCSHYLYSVDSKHRVLRVQVPLI